jgi:hypothetical protein
MGARKISDDTWVGILNRVVLKPRLKPAARAVGIDPSTLFLKIKQSIADPENHKLVWLDTLDTFANHLQTARRLSIVELDRAALQLGIEGHAQPRFHDGKPVFKTDMQVAADALTLDEMDWIAKYGTRSRDDHYARDKDGKLIQEQVVSPPNAQLVAKLLSSLIPAYREQSTVEHHHTGHVWIEGTQTQAVASPRQDNLLGFDIPAEQQRRPTNLLALLRPCVNSEEFDKKFRKKLLREVVLFRDADNKLMPPLPDDVIVAGTPQHRAFQDAGFEINAVRAETLLDEGFENEWLREIAPAWKPTPKPKPVPPTEAECEEVAVKVQQKIANVTPAGKASARYDSENLGYGKPPPGGRRVRL